MIGAGSICVLHLVNPSEKLWGMLGELGPAGVSLRGLNLSSFDDWMRQEAGGASRALGLVTMFVPLARVERIFLDEPVGEVESYCQRFERHVGRPVAASLAPPAR